MFEQDLENTNFAQIRVVGVGGAGQFVVPNHFFAVHGVRSLHLMYTV